MRSRTVANGIYDSLESAKRALIQYKNSYYGGPDLFIERVAIGEWEKVTD
jgi:hypothetical protein